MVLLSSDHKPICAIRPNPFCTIQQIQTIQKSIVIFRPNKPAANWAAVLYTEVTQNKDTLNNFRRLSTIGLNSIKGFAWALSCWVPKCRNTSGKRQTWIQNKFAFVKYCYNFVTHKLFLRLPVFQVRTNWLLSRHVHCYYRPYVGAN